MKTRFLPFLILFPIMSFASCVSTPPVAAPQAAAAPAPKTEPAAPAPKPAEPAVPQAAVAPAPAPKTEPAAPAPKPAEPAAPQADAAPAPKTEPAAPAPKPAAPAAPQAAAAAPPKLGGGAKPAPAAPARTDKPVARIGELVYFEGDVAVRRKNRTFSGDDLDLGFGVQPYDLLTTGVRSGAELDVNQYHPGGALVRVSEKTAFYFDVGGTDAPATDTDIRMLAGSLALKVQRLGGTGRVNVSTENTVFGVRGTEFIVSAAVEGSLLVTCVEGRVECDDGGLPVYAEPGRAVVRPRDGELGTRPVAPADLGRYRNEWLRERTEAFLGDPAKYAASYLAEFDRRGPSFDTAVRGLESHAAVWAKWEGMIASGRLPSFLDLAEDKKLVNAAMFAAARELYFFEPVLFRLIDMADALEAAGKAGSLSGLPAIAGGIQERLARLQYVRWVFALYGAISDGSPLGDFFMERAGGSGWDF
jgi:hypothetical protein